MWGVAKSKGRRSDAPPACVSKGPDLGRSGGPSGGLPSVVVVDCDDRGHVQDRAGPGVAVAALDRLLKIPAIDADILQHVIVEARQCIGGLAPGDPAVEAGDCAANGVSDERGEMKAVMGLEGFEF